MNIWRKLLPMRTKAEKNLDDEQMRERLRLRQEQESIARRLELIQRRERIRLRRYEEQK